MSAVIISVGNELALGRRRDINGAVIARALATLGLETSLRCSVSADAAELTALLQESARRFDLLIVAGGLAGPDAPTAEALRRWATGTPEELPNPVGATSGLRLEQDGTLAFFLPGAEPELEATLEQQVLPTLAARTEVEALGFHALRVFSPADTDIENRLAGLDDTADGLELAVRQDGAETVVMIWGRAPSARAAEERARRLGVDVCARLGRDVHGPLGQDLPQAVGEALRARGWTLATVEVGPGGVVPPLLAELPESGRVFRLGLALDDRSLMAEILGLDDDLPDETGLVSSEGALALARGVLDRGAADLGLAIVGVTGPDCGSTETPVGLVHFALVGRGDASPHQQQERFSGMSGRRLRQQCGATALRLVLDRCREKEG